MVIEFKDTPCLFYSLDDCPYGYIDCEDCEDFINEFENTEEFED